MVAYREIAELPVEELLSSADAPLMVNPQTSVADATLFLAQQKKNVAIVRMGENEFKPISLERLRVAVQAVGGDGSKVLVGSVVGHDDPIAIYEVPATVTVATLAESGSPGEVLMVTDPGSGEPQAILDRTQLANRIRGLVS